jgi:hypothetical protein
MNRRLAETAAAATAAVLLASGCTPSHDRAESVSTTAKAAEQAPLIDVQQPELPANIGNVALNTVEIHAQLASVFYQDTNGKKLGWRISPKAGSGTIINYHGAKVIVSASHVESGMDGHCADQGIHYPANGANAALAGSVAATSPAPEKAGDNTYFHSKDSSVLIPPPTTRLALYPGLTTQDNIDIHVGENVFSLGYGPRKDADPNPLSHKADWQQPAIIPGTVVRVKNGTASFITNIGSYGPLYDTEVESGDSGGPVVDSDGSYLGDVINKTVGDESIGTIERQYGVNLPDENPNRTFNVATVQLVDTARLTEMVNATHGCDSQPSLHQEVPVGTDIYTVPMPSS